MSEKSVEDRLKNRLKNVPGVTDADVGIWVEESVIESGLTTEENENAVFYMALTIAYETIASDAAKYFSYTDRDEVVDKSNVFKNYLTLAEQSRKSYRKARRGGGAFQTHAGRADER